MALKYKIGDRVRIKSLDWYYDNRDRIDEVACGNTIFIPKMSNWCGKIATIKEICKTNCYHLEEYDFDWTDEMIEGLVEEETKPKFKVGDRVIVRDASGIWEITNVEDNILYTIKRENHTFTLTTYGGFLTLYEGISDKMIESKVEEGVKNWADVSIPDGPYTVTYDSPSKNDSMSKNMTYNEIILPEGYQFVDENGNVINATKIVLEKKKKEYPKTLEECCEVLDTGGYQIDYFVKPGEVYEYEKALITKISALYNLIICRDAYWTLYGEEKGLGKPWEPDWINPEQLKYTIYYYKGGIKKDYWHCHGHILVFPTEEMMEEFYENFKKEIEMCKELL